MKKAEVEKLRKSLLHNPKNGAAAMDAAESARCKAYCETYKAFLDDGKTERDCVAQAVKQADKVPIVRMRALHCAVPYALEGLVRREIAAAGGRLDDIRHGEAVAFGFTLAEAAADALIARLGELCQGRVVWERPE